MRNRALALALVSCVGLALLASQAFGAGVGYTASDRAAFQKLDSTIVSFTFSDQPLEEAIDFLTTLGGVNIVLDKRKVEAGKTVTLKLSNITLETAVKLVCEQVGLKWVVRDGIVFISDEEGTKMEPITIVYDCSDLLSAAPNFEGPTFELQNISSNSGRGGSGGSGGSSSSIFSSDTGGKKDDASAKSQEEMLNDLVDLIKQVIEPGTWGE